MGTIRDDVKDTIEYLNTNNVDSCGRIYQTSNEEIEEPVIQIEDYCISHDEKYGGIYINIPITEFNDNGFASFDIYNGETLLREGKDYKLHLIKNQNKNYAYIKGKGIYDGYALIRLKSISSIPENNEEDKPESKEIVCANYLSNTTNALSRYITSSVSVNKVKIKSLKKYKKAFKVILAKNKNVSGYEIRYSQNKNMDSCTLKNIGKSTSKKFKVKRKTTYYVQARAYKDVNGIRYYSGWSTAKKVKTK